MIQIKQVTKPLLVISQISTKRSCNIGKHFKSRTSAYKPIKYLYFIAINAHLYFNKDDIIVDNFELTVAFDDPGPFTKEQYHINLGELDCCTPPHLPYPIAPANEDFSPPDLSIEDI